MIYQAGNTVRFSCSFWDFGKVGKVEPSNVRFIVYSARYDEIIAEIPVSERTEEGGYFVDYTLPNDRGIDQIIYEWNGIVDGLPSIYRDTIGIVFV